MYRGRIRFTSPMIWFLGFVFLFTMGGVAGVLMAVPPIDFQVHNSLFLVAHFHTMIISGVVFGFFAGLTYWFPKIFGFTLNERLGKYAAWCWIIGFFLAFAPLYILGLMGATRRLDHYDASLGWQPLFIVAGIGVLIICLGVGFQLLQLIVSIRQRKDNLDLTGDPWGARTLEWATSSPPPEYNFAVIPHVTGRDAFWTAKHSRRKAVDAIEYEAIRVAKNTPSGVLIGAASLGAGFGFVWHIWWLVIVALLGLAATILWQTLRDDDDGERTIPAHEIAAIEAKFLTQKETA
jgi:cytochrome o ubiquinol oxidase subunit I